METDCRKISGLIRACVDEELDAASLEIVRRHLEKCPACGRRLQLMSALKAALGRIKPAASEGFTRDLLVRIGKHAGDAPRGRWARAPLPYRVLSPALGLALVLALLWYVPGKKTGRVGQEAAGPQIARPASGPILYAYAYNVTGAEGPLNYSASAGYPCLRTLCGEPEAPR